MENSAKAYFKKIKIILIWDGVFKLKCNNDFLENKL